MRISTIEWSGDAIKLIDQTKLPARLEYVRIKDLRSLWQAVKEMKVRGAPALGAAGAFGVYLGIKDSRAKNFAEFFRQMDKAAKYIASCRPTARNLFWGVERMCSLALKHRGISPERIKEILLREAQAVIAEDRRSCRAIGSNGARLFKSGDAILTVCNAGSLATTGYGTALGVIYRAKEEGKKIKVYACETRPMLQGARLTAWELFRSKVDVTLICDNMAATLMRQGKIDRVIAGADRIAANGDTANKIGTYMLAVLSRYHRIPFYIAAPASTFDLSIKSGKGITIEERPAFEMTELFFRKAIAPEGVKVYNPAFDVTPHQLISAIITDKGVIRKPGVKNIKRKLSVR